MGMRAIGIGMDSDLEICVRCMRALERLYLLIRRVLGRRSLLGLLLVSTITEHFGHCAPHTAAQSGLTL